MKRFNQFLSTFLAVPALIFLAALPSHAQANAVRIEFTPVHSYASEEDGIFFSNSFYPMVVVSDRNDNIYVLDAGSNTLMSFDSSHDLRWRTGTPGRGPGDFERPNGMVFHDGYLFISNQSGSRLDQFDPSGNYIRSFNIDDIGELVAIKGATSSGRLVFSATVWGILGTKVIVAELNGNSLEVLNEFTVNHAPDIDLGGGLSSGGDITIVNSEITVGNKTDFAITVYNLSGDMIRTVTKDTDNIVRPGFKNEGGSRSIREFGGVQPLRKLSEEYFITTATWPLNVDDPDEIVRGNTFESPSNVTVHYANSIDLFDRNGNLVYTREYEGFYNPETGNIVHVNPEGYVYGIKDEPVPQLTKYRVTIIE